MCQCLYHTPCARCSRPDVSGRGAKSTLTSFGTIATEQVYKVQILDELLVNQH